jgi:hypothetical protein
MPTIITAGAASAKGFGFQSKTGLIWSAPAIMGGSAAGVQMHAVAVNNSGLYVAVGFIASNGIAVYSTSSDGVNWSAPTVMPGSPAVAYMTAIAVNSSGLFVATGRNSLNYPLIATSSNGTTWTTPTSIISSVLNQPAIAVNSSGLFVLTGYDTSSRAVFTYSTNGTTWTNGFAYFNGSTSVFQVRGIAVNSSGRFVAVGNGVGPNNLGLFTTSTNGTTWTTPAVMNNSGATFVAQSVTVNSSGLFIAVGYNASIQCNCATSSNGTTWTSPTDINVGGAIPFSTAGLFPIVVNNNTGLFVAIYDNPSVYPSYLSTFNGTTWSSGAIATGSVFNVRGATINSNGLIAAVGYDSSNGLALAGK